MSRKTLLFSLLICLVARTPVWGQAPWELFPQFFLEGDFKIGEFSEKLGTASLTNSYPNVLNPVSGNITFTESRSNSYNLEFGGYLNHKRTFGIGTGFIYQRQRGNIGTDTFHVEFESTDYKGNVFRQLISSNGPINESVKISSISIPIFLRYRKDIVEDLFLTVDAGVVLNVMLQNKYATNTGFDYEAIYKFAGSSNNPNTVYDNSPIPGPSDWLITSAQFLKTNPNGDVTEYFNFLHGLGYNVGLGDSVRKSGTVTYHSKSIGFNLQPALNYKISPKIYGKAGLYVMYQSFENATQNTSGQFASKMGDYNSLLNYTKTIQSISYGVMFGINYLFK